MFDGIGNKVVLILGGAGGIGAACARGLAQRGARVTVADIDDSKAAAVANSVSGGSHVCSRRVDVTKREDVLHLVDEVVGESGRLDVLLNCAGVMYIRPLVEICTAEWETTVELNLKGTLWGVAAALPTFIDQGYGHFVTVGSIHGHKVFRGGAVHSASKFGVLAFAEGLRAELAPYGIRVTMVLPGAVDTGMQEKTTGTERDRMEEIYRSAISPEAIARAICFAIEQPDDVAINEIVVRPTAQEI
jgi:NADP-dependent 3-hydroxy acid dehydrogenase YdfG